MRTASVTKLCTIYDVWAVCVRIFIVFPLLGTSYIIWQRNPAVSCLMFFACLLVIKLYFLFSPLLLLILLLLLLSSDCWLLPSRRSRSLYLHLIPGSGLMLRTKAEKKHLTHSYFLYIKADDETNCRTWTGEAKLLLLLWLNNKQNEPRVYIWN